MKKYIKYVVILIIVVIAGVLFVRYRKAKSAPEWRRILLHAGLR